MVRNFPLFYIMSVSLTLMACSADFTSTKPQSQSDTQTTQSKMTSRKRERPTNNKENLDNSCVNLGAAKGFNMFLFGDLSQPSADTEGRVAVGGNATLANYSIGDKLPLNPQRMDLVVAGNLTFTSGDVSRGSALVAGRSSIGQVSFAGQLTQGSPGINFHTTQALIKDEARRLSELRATSTPQFETWGQEKGSLRLAGDDSSLNVFNVSATDISRAYRIEIDVPSASVVLINVNGATASLKNMDILIKGTTPEKVLFNLPDCKQLTISGISVEGSILAPNANIIFPSGVVRGQIIANALKGQGQINNNPLLCSSGDDNNQSPPNPTLPDPPEDVPEIPYN